MPQSGCLCQEVPGTGEKGFGLEHSHEEHPQVFLWPQPGADSHVRELHRRLEIQQASGFEPNWDSEGESESGMGVGRSPFIHCSQRLLFWEGVLPPSLPPSLLDAEAGLSGGFRLCGSHIYGSPWLGMLSRQRLVLSWGIVWLCLKPAFFLGAAR